MRTNHETLPDLQQHFVSLFPTPLINYYLSAIDNAALADWIADLAVLDRGVAKSNVGGWHSQTGLFSRQFAPLQQLEFALTGIVKAVFLGTGGNQPPPFQLDAWANLLVEGEYNTLHCHPNAIWSGVYYVTGNPMTEGDHAFSGRLEFFDPRPTGTVPDLENSKLHNRCMINPRAGQVLVFPGWLQHMVHPVGGTVPRISIAFNVVEQTP